MLAENVYWESTTDDDLGDAKNDDQFKTVLAKWADLSALNTMPASELHVSAHLSDIEHRKAGRDHPGESRQPCGFFRACGSHAGSLTAKRFCPITYDDNYITVFPHETRTIQATFNSSAGQVSPAVSG